MFSIMNQGDQPVNIISDTVEDQNSPIDRLEGGLLTGASGQISILQSLEIDYSRTTDNIRFISKRNNTEIDNPVEKTLINIEQCEHCQHWRKWAQNSEKKLLEIQMKLIQKEKKLTTIMNSLTLKIKQQESSLHHKTLEIQNIKQDYQTKIRNIGIPQSNPNHQNKPFIATIRNKNSSDQRNGHFDEITEPTMKYCYSNKNQPSSIYQGQTLKAIKPPSYLQKSNIQQTITDCSFLDCQNIDFSSCCAQNRNSAKNPESMEIKSLTEQKRELIKEMDRLKFQNQNLKSYNRVLLQRLSKSKFRKY